jgi:hypothetical protein
VANPAPLQLLLLGVSANWVRLRGSSPICLARVGITAASVALAGYAAIVALRAVPTWSAVYYGEDGSPGPSLFVLTLGIVARIPKCRIILDWWLPGASSPRWLAMD